MAAPYRNVPDYSYSGQLPDAGDDNIRMQQLYEQHRQQQLQCASIQGDNQLDHAGQQLLRHQQSALIGSPMAHLGNQTQFGGPQHLNFDTTLQQQLMMDVGGMEEMGQHSIGGYQQEQHHLIQQHHHHQLPESSRPRKISGSGESDDNSNVPSVVGQPGMPPPAPRPRGPKLKFTPEDDALLVELKENKALSWKQIAEFFPGRSSGTLQVRYCTRLKAKETLWTDDTVSLFSSFCEVLLYDLEYPTM